MAVLLEILGPVADFNGREVYSVESRVSGNFRES